MRSEVYLRENLVALLAALAQAHSDLAQRLDDRDALVYSEGFHAALNAVATALGISSRLDSDASRFRQYEVRQEGLLEDPLEGMVIRIDPLPKP